MKRYLPFLIVFAVALLVFGSGFFFSRARTLASAAETAQAKKTDENLKNEAAHVRGPTNAPISLEIYGDFQCPPCKLASEAIEKLEKSYAGRMRVIYREFPLSMHPNAMPAALAAEAASEQNRFWEMHDLLYKNQDQWSEERFPEQFFTRYAESLGMNMEKFSADMHSNPIRARIVSAGDVAMAGGIHITPSIFINGIRFHGRFTEGNLREAIESALKDQSRAPGK